MSDLSSGHSYFGGTVLRSSRQPGIAVSEIRYSQPRTCRPHTHDRAFFSVLLNGSYSERFGGSTQEHQPFRLGFHPPAMLHRDEIGDVNTRFLIIELSRQWLDGLDAGSSAIVPLLCNAHGSWLAMSLYDCFLGDRDVPLEIESLALEMLATVFHSHEEQRRPRWIGTLLDLLHSEFTQKLTVLDLARRLDLHPVYLSRQFRKWCGQSLGKSVHDLRMSYALDLLHQSELPLSEIALQVGYADQSQFTKAFRRFHGVTPGAFRYRPCAKNTLQLTFRNLAPHHGPGG